jgi:hypothetical protein
MPAFSLLFGAASILFAPKFDPLFWANPLPWAVYIINSIILSIVIGQLAPEQKISHPLLVMAFGAWWLISHFFITILALFTMDAPDWGTRTKKVLEEAT